MNNNLQPDHQTQTMDLRFMKPVPESNAASGTTCENLGVQFTVPRIEGLTLSTLAIITATVENPKLTNEQDFLLTLKRTVTAWINTSEAGRRAWKSTANDFNVGDLAHYLDDDELERQLKLHGISELKVEVMNLSRGNWLFDTILANYEMIEEDDGGY
jgi:hypothetical protein